jgi:hypothetical protein
VQETDKCIDRTRSAECTLSRENRTRFTRWSWFEFSFPAYHAECGRQRRNITIVSAEYGMTQSDLGSKPRKQPSYDRSPIHDTMAATADSEVSGLLTTRSARLRRELTSRSVGSVVNASDNSSPLRDFNLAR